MSFGNKWILVKISPQNLCNSKQSTSFSSAVLLLLILSHHNLLAVHAATHSTHRIILWHIHPWLLHSHAHHGPLLTHHPHWLLSHSHWLLSHSHWLLLHSHAHSHFGSDHLPTRAIACDIVLSSCDILVCDHLLHVHVEVKQLIQVEFRVFSQNRKHVFECCLQFETAHSGFLCASVEGCHVCKHLHSFLGFVGRTRMLDIDALYDHIEIAHDSDSNMKL